MQIDGKVLEQCNVGIEMEVGKMSDVLFKITMHVA